MNTQGSICNEWFGIKSYPSLLAINDKHGVRQEFQGNFHDPNTVIKWIADVAKEWKWLFKNANLAFLTGDTHEFHDRVINSTQFWIVIYVDGFDCSSCKTAKTNAMRLSASLKAFQGNVSVGIVNCEAEGIISFYIYTNAFQI